MTTAVDCEVFAVACRLFTELVYCVYWSCYCVRNVNVLAKQSTLIKQKEPLPIIGTMCYLQFLPTHFEEHLSNFYDSNKWKIALPKLFSRAICMSKALLCLWKSSVIKLGCVWYLEAEKQQQVAKITWQQNIEQKEAQKKISQIEGKFGSWKSIIDSIDSWQKKKQLIAIFSCDWSKS